MDQERYEKGLAMRKAVLGAPHVERSLANADDFTRPFQEVITEFCWGFGWSDERIPPQTRSLMNLTMIAALNRMEEWELHLKGALNNGISKGEIQATIHQIAIYCGIPAGLNCQRIAVRVFNEMEAAA
jgi:4-carboxymuconolactone decarboxylase